MREKPSQRSHEEWRRPVRPSGRGWRRFWLRVAGFAGGALVWAAAGLSVGVAGMLLPAGLPIDVQPLLVLAGGFAGAVLGDIGPRRRHRRPRAPEGVPLMLFLALAGVVVSAAFLAIAYSPLVPQWRRSTAGLGPLELLLLYLRRGILLLPAVAHAVVHAMGGAILLAPFAVATGWAYNACDGALREE